MMVDWDVKAKKADGDERRVEATNVWLLPPPRETRRQRQGNSSKAGGRADLSSRARLASTIGIGRGLERFN